LGDIPPHKIDMRLPAAVMLECLDHHIATHPDGGFRDQLKTLRKHVAASPPDQLEKLNLRVDA
jgi:hypothetical protein